jgi:hypothetical protein
MEGGFWLVLLATFAIIGLAVLGMALGAMTTGRCLRGSCGGPEARLPSGESLACGTCPNRKQPAPARVQRTQ